MTFFIYSRKSVYTGKGESVENQVEMCKEYLQAKFPDFADAETVIYEDEGFSAKSTDRPQFQQMMRDIVHKKPNYLVCYRLDRISRNVSDFASLIETLSDRSISFICIREEFDTSKPMGKAMMYIASVFAQLERETIAERVRDNMLMLARTGRWLGGTTPMGYTAEREQEILIDGRLKSACRLRENREELVAVDTIFDKYLELHSISGVSKYLIQNDIRTRSGNYFSLPGIKEILQNPVYCTADQDAFDYFTRAGAEVCFDPAQCGNGLLAYNKRDYQKRHAPRRPVEKWILAAGKHKGRISGERWAAVQQILEDNVPTGNKPAKMHNDYALLSGLITCKACGSRMFAKRRSGKGAAPDAFDYICNSKLRGGLSLCTCQNISGREADEIICEHLLQQLQEETVFIPLLEKHRQAILGYTTEKPVDAIERRKKKYREEIDNLLRALSQSGAEPAFVRHVSTKIEALEQELAELDTAQEHFIQTAAQTADKDREPATPAEIFSSLKNCFSFLSVYEKRNFVRMLVREIIWDGGELHVFFKQ